MMKNWKTTAAGILSALLGLSGPSTVLLAALQAIKAAQPGAAAANYTIAIWGAILTFIFAVLRGWLGLIQNDAPSPEALAQAISSASKTPASIAAVTKGLVPVLFICLMLPFLLLAGCAKGATTLPPGAYAPADATTDEVLSAASAAVRQYETDVAAGFVPAATLRTTMQDMQKALAIAIPAYQAWHAALATAPTTPQPAALVTAVSTINSSLAALPNATK